MTNKEDKYLLKFETESKDGLTEHKFTIPYYVYKDNDLYIAYCPSLDITTSGKDFNDAIAQFYENFQLYIEYCLEENTLIDDLIDHGWKLDGVKLLQPTLDELLVKQEFRHLLESDTEYERLNAVFKLQPITV